MHVCVRTIVQSKFCHVNALNSYVYMYPTVVTRLYRVLSQALIETTLELE